MQTDSEIYRRIEPLIQRLVSASITATTSTSSTLAPSLTGALLADGTVMLNGNLAVSPGKLIDGWDIDVALSYLYTTVATTEAFAYSGLGLSNTDDGATYTLILTSSSYPGAAASILASDSSGRLGVQNLGLGIAAQTGYALYSSVSSPSYIANDLRIGTTAAGALSARLHVLTTGTQAQFSYDTSNYGFVGVGSAGTLTLGNTGTTAANAHIYLNPGGGSAKVGIGNSIPTPTAKLEVNSTTEQLRLNYSGSFYTAFTVSSAGHLTIDPTGGSGRVGIGNSIPTPTAKLEVNSTTEQLRLNYSGAVYAAFTVSSAGNLTIDPSGANIYTSDHIGHPSYASQTSYWRISNAGEADFRYLYTDELHAKAFIADLEQALAGGQIISKSVAKIYANFAAPTAGNTANLDVEEFAGFAAFHVFVDGDLVRIRQFDRSGGGLKIADIWGTVVYSAQVASSNPPAQRYVFTRHATYPGTGSGTISAGTLVLDYGTTGNGYYEVNAIDGAAGINSPYTQIVTWATHPKSVTANQGLQLRVRMGQLRGLTGVSQFGLYAGTGWTANPNEGNVAQYTVTTPTVNDAHRYILAGDNGVDIYNANLNVYSSTTPVITLDRTGPDLSIGSGSDTMTYTSGAAGFWVGNDSGTYKMRLGSVSGGALTAGLSWDGSALRVLGSAYIGPQVAYSTTALLYTRFDCTTSGGTVNITGHLGQVATLTGTLTTQSGIIAGQAIRIYSGCTLSYAASGNIATSVGTISFWMNPAWDGNDTTNRDILFCGASTYFAANTIRITRAPTSDGGNRIRFLIVDGSAGGRFADYNVPTSGFKTWAYYTFTWKASTASIKIYRNAVLVASYSGTTWTPGSAATLIEFTKTYAGDQGIQDFAIIGRELSVDEISSIYNSNAPLSITASNYSLILADASSSGYVRGHATGLFGYSDQTGGAGTGAFALVTTASTALGTPFGSITLDAGDMILGSASSGKSNLYWDQSAGSLTLRIDTTSRLTLDTSGNLLLGNSSGNNLYWDNSASSLSVRNSTTKRIELTSAGVLNINNNSGTAVIKLDGSGNSTIEQTVKFGSSGSIIVGSNDVVLDVSGITLLGVTSFANVDALKWYYSGQTSSQIYNIIDTGVTTSTLNLRATAPSSGYNGIAQLSALNFTQTNATLGLQAASNGSAYLRFNNAATYAMYADTSVFSFWVYGPTHGDGVKVIYIGNAGTVPTTNPSGGGVLYVTGGALRYRGSSGTVTNLAPA